MELRKRKHPIGLKLHLRRADLLDKIGQQLLVIISLQKASFWWIFLETRQLIDSTSMTVIYVYEALTWVVNDFRRHSDHSTNGVGCLLYTSPSPRD